MTVLYSLLDRKRFSLAKEQGVPFCCQKKMGSDNLGESNEE